MRWSFGCDLSSQFGTRLPASEARAGFGLRRSFPGCDKPVSTEFATLLVEIEFGASRRDDHGFR
jgi:hypothetical protein